MKVPSRDVDDRSRGGGVAGRLLRQLDEPRFGVAAIGGHQRARPQRAGERRINRASSDEVRSFLGDAGSYDEPKLAAFPKGEQGGERGMQAELPVEIEGRGVFDFRAPRRRDGGTWSRAVVGVFAVGHEQAEPIGASSQENKAND